MIAKGVGVAFAVLIIVVLFILFIGAVAGYADKQRKLWAENKAKAKGGKNGRTS